MAAILDRAVLVVCDSLRRDMLGPRTPSILRFARFATSFEGHRAIFPSAPRVTSASIATGCLPARHGVHGNAMALNEGDGLKAFSVGRPDFVDRLRRLTGRALRVPTIAERLSGRGGSLVFSNASAGAAYFQDPDGYGFVYHSAGSYGPGRERVSAGDEMHIRDGADGDREMTNRFCREIEGRRLPALSVLWLSEPDWSAHHHPLGSAPHIDAIAAADGNAGRVLDALGREALLDEGTLVIVCSDHGNETVRREIDIEGELVRAGLKADPLSTDVVSASSGTSALVYFSGDQGDYDQVCAYLRRQDWVGELYQEHRLQEVGLRAEGGLRLALTMATSDEPNAYGIVGHADLAIDPDDTKRNAGCGHHGGLGLNEQSPFLMISGRGFPPGARQGSATSPIDIAPTVLRHLGIDFERLDGRTLQA